MEGESDELGIYVVDMTDLLDPSISGSEFLARELLPEPNCNNPDCESCMALRRLRGETLLGEARGPFTI